MATVLESPRNTHLLRYPFLAPSFLTSTVVSEVDSVLVSSVAISTTGMSASPDAPSFAIWVSPPFSLKELFLTPLMYAITRMIAKAITTIPNEMAISSFVPICCIILSSFLAVFLFIFLSFLNISFLM